MSLKTALRAVKEFFTGSLKSKIRLGTVLITVAVVGGLTAALYWNEKQEVRRHYEERSKELNRFLTVSLFQAMEDHRPERLSATMAKLAGRGGLERVFVVNREGRVRFSSETQEIGRLFSRASPSCQICHFAPPEERARAVLFSENGRDVFRSVAVLENRTECQSCHGTEARINGILIADYSVAPYAAYLGKKGTFFLLLALAATLGILAAQRWLIFSVLVRRMQKLLAAAEKSCANNEDASSPPAGRPRQASADELDILFDHHEEISKRLNDACESLRRHRDDLERIMNSLDDGLMVLDRDFRVLMANRACLRRLGKRKEDVVGKPCYPDLCPAQGGDSWKQACPRHAPPAEGMTSLRVVHLRGADGLDTTLEILTTPVFDETGKPCEYIEVARDITERVRLDERMRRAETLVQVGQLATGIAHEINNPLASMAACVDGLRRQAKRPELTSIAAFESFPRYMDLLDREIYRCKNITNQVLSLVRASGGEAKAVSLAALAEETLSLMASRFAKEHCAVRFDAGEKLPPLRGDEGKLRQLLLNLLINAVEALDGEPRRIHVSLSSPEDGVLQLLVRDTGRGVPLSLSEKIFEPFFTTKPHGNSLGLGLAICRGIAEEHGGRLTLHEPSEGRGAEFRAYLPASEKNLHGIAR